MASRSKSTNSTENKTEDSRVSADGGSVGVSADGDVTIHQVADEAFELGEFAIETVGDVLGQARLTKASFSLQMNCVK